MSGETVSDVSCDHKRLSGEDSTVNGDSDMTAERVTWAGKLRRGATFRKEENEDAVNERGKAEEETENRKTT